MKRYLTFIFLVPLLLQTGCYPAFKLELDGLEPAEITIPSAIKTISVLSRVDVDSLYKDGKLQNGKKASFERDSSIVKQGIIGCADALIASPRFEVYDPIIRRSLVGDFSDGSQLLPWSVIRAVAGVPPIDAVLSLEYSEFRDTVVARRADGWIYYQLDIIVKTYWRIYRLAQYSVSDYLFTDTLHAYIGEDANLIVSTENKLSLLKQALYLAGENTGRRLAPYWTDLERIYFPFGNKEFSLAGKYMRDGEWKAAAEIWNRYTPVRSKPLAARACFNMAVTCEMAGNITLALEWLKESEKKGMDTYFITDYRAKLKERLPKTLKLDQQMAVQD